MDAIIEAGVDYVFLCGDLFERRTLRPHLVQFAHDELYRLAKETKELHNKRVKILVIRGNHDGRPQSNTLDYINHPLADYLHVFQDDNVVYKDNSLFVVGLNYYDLIQKAFDELVIPAMDGVKGVKILMIHGIVHGYNPLPHYTNYITLEQLASANPSFVFAGHFHRRCRPRRLLNGGWILTPGSLEMYNFAEQGEKGFYIVDIGEGDPVFTWIPIQPTHIMKQSQVTTERRQSPSWYRDKIFEQVNSFQMELKKTGEKGYLRIRVEGGLRDGYPGDIDLAPITGLIETDPSLIWVDVDTLALDLPLTTRAPERELVDIREYFSSFGEFADDIGEMHAQVREVLEEDASLQTGLLTPSKRVPMVKDWLKRFEKRTFWEKEE